MVVTKHFVIRNLNKLHQAKEYIENAEKTVVSENEDQNSHFENIFPYVMNKDKTWSRQLVTGYMCNPESAMDDFEMTKMIADMENHVYPEKAYDKNPKSVLAHHLIQSFSPEDQLTPEQIHEIGQQTVLELFGPDYQFVIATHVDKAHIHNHIIINSTNMITNKKFNWQVAQYKNKKNWDKTYHAYQQISDKIAARYGAKIIDQGKQTPKNSYTKYSKWKNEESFKKKIKSRLDFLLAHSSSIEDFNVKALALNLEVNFTGKHPTYKLLDEPQVKFTRGRVLNKKDPEKYNMDRIQKRLKENEGINLSDEEIIERYKEVTQTETEDFELLMTVTPEQISQITDKGMYVNVKFDEHTFGQIFISSINFDLETVPNGQQIAHLYLKNKDSFYFMNEKGSDKNRKIYAKTLVNLLGKENGTLPLKRDPRIPEIDRLISAIGFLSQKGVSNGMQFKNLQLKLQITLEETRKSLEENHQMILKLKRAQGLIFSQERGTILAASQADFLNEVLQSNKIEYDEIHNFIKTYELEYQALKESYDDVVKDKEQYREILREVRVNEQFKELPKEQKDNEKI